MQRLDDSDVLEALFPMVQAPVLGMRPKVQEFRSELSRLPTGPSSSSVDYQFVSGPQRIVCGIKRIAPLSTIGTFDLRGEARDERPNPFAIERRRSPVDSAISANFSDVLTERHQPRDRREPGTRGLMQ